jgi:hypothetical protein
MLQERFAGAAPARLPRMLRTLMQRTRHVIIGLYGRSALDAPSASGEAARARLIHQIKL